VADWVDKVVDWLVTKYDAAFDTLKAPLVTFMDALEAALQALPPEVILIGLALLAWYLAGKKVAVMSAAGLWVLYAMGLWRETMTTLALVLVATALAVGIGIPLGILTAQNHRVEQVVRPLLDFMQTMPSFVYLIPVLMLFGIGKVPAVFATLIFAMPPAVRLTSLGIRQVPTEVVEAAKAFGSSRWQLLAKVQFPIALPTVMTGVNQSIMLALSMAVISAMIGAGGLGGVVYAAISRVEVGKGFAGGIGIVVLALILDRVTQGIAGRSAVKKSSTAWG
jgi:glycine betaine/proline transport system permease protein